MKDLESVIRGLPAAVPFHASDEQLQTFNKMRDVVEPLEGLFFPVPEAFSQYKDAVGKVVNRYGHQIGTGFLGSVKNRIFLFSALHCFSIGNTFDSSLTMISSTGEEIAYRKEDLQSKVNNNDFDIVTLRVEKGREYPSVQLDERTLINHSQLGASIVIGYPHEYLLHNSGISGPLLSIGARTLFTSEVIRTETRIEGGSSGAPVFDERWKVIGVAVRNGRDDENEMNSPESLYHDSPCLATPVAKVLPSLQAFLK